MWRGGLGGCYFVGSILSRGEKEEQGENCILGSLVLVMPGFHALAIEGMGNLSMLRVAGLRRSCEVYITKLIDQRTRATLLIIHTTSLRS